VLTAGKSFIQAIDFVQFSFYINRKYNIGLISKIIHDIIFNCIYDILL